jgi:hypothetical protein
MMFTTDESKGVKNPQQTAIINGIREMPESFMKE